MVFVPDGYIFNQLTQAVFNAIDLHQDSKPSPRFSLLYGEVITFYVTFIHSDHVSRALRCCARMHTCWRVP